MMPCRGLGTSKPTSKPTFQPTAQGAKMITAGFAATLHGTLSFVTFFTFPSTSSLLVLMTILFIDFALVLSQWKYIYN